MPELWLFVGALVVTYLMPGPDMVLLLQTGAVQGRARALAAAVGLGLARATHVTLAALGLAALLRTAPMLFDAIRLAGAAYLIWLGIGILRAPSFLPGQADTSADSHAMPLAVAVRHGLLTNLLNPKALLFCSVLLPQFIHPEAGGVAGQFLLLGVVLVGIGALFDGVYAVTGAALGRWVARHAMVEALQRWSFASLLIGFGARLALA